MGSAWSTHKGPLLSQLFISPLDTWNLDHFEKEIDDNIQKTLEDLVGCKEILYKNPFRWNVTPFPSKKVQRGRIRVKTNSSTFSFLIKERHTPQGNHYKIYRCL